MGRRVVAAGAVAVAVLGMGAALSAPAWAQPADVEQAVGLPASGQCTDVDDTGLNWAGVASGGWSHGWGEWLNDGAGGHACVRTLTFDSATETWSVR